MLSLDIANASWVVCSGQSRDTLIVSIAREFAIAGVGDAFEKMRIQFL